MNLPLHPHDLLLIRTYAMYQNTIGKKDILEQISKWTISQQSLSTNLNIIARLCELPNYPDNYLYLWHNKLLETYKKEDIIKEIQKRNISWIIEKEENKESLIYQFYLLHAIEAKNYQLIQPIFTIAYVLLGSNANSFKTYKVDLLSIFLNTSLHFKNDFEHIKQIVDKWISDWINNGGLLPYYYAFFDLDNTFSRYPNLYKENPNTTHFLINNFGLYLVNPILLIKNLIKNELFYGGLYSLLQIYEHPNKKRLHSIILMNLFSKNEYGTVYDLLKPLDPQNKLKSFNPKEYHYFTFEKSYQIDIKNIFEQDLYHNNLDLNYHIARLQEYSNIPNAYNYALLIACQTNKKEEHYNNNYRLALIDFLLDNGANINSRETSTNYLTPLLLASTQQDKEVILKLIKKGAYILDSQSSDDSFFDTLLDSSITFTCPLIYILNMNDSILLKEALVNSNLSQEELKQANEFYDFFQKIVFNDNCSNGISLFQTFYDFGVKPTQPSFDILICISKNKMALFDSFITNVVCDERSMFEFVVNSLMSITFLNQQTELQQVLRIIFKSKKLKFDYIYHDLQNNIQYTIMEKVKHSLTIENFYSLEAIETEMNIEKEKLLLDNLVQPINDNEEDNKKGRKKI